jgi:HrpA-like RNA helicase
MDPQNKVELVRIHIAKFLQDLPAYKHRANIVKEINDYSNNFCILIGHTGSGKSTQVP